jgi:hypothetical protein
MKYLTLFGTMANRAILISLSKNGTPISTGWSKVRATTRFHTYSSFL